MKRENAPVMLSLYGVSSYNNRQGVNVASDANTKILGVFGRFL